MQTDEQLIAIYLKGDEKALEVLISRYLKPIYSFVYKYTGGNSQTAEDITQEVFVKMWRNLKRYKKGNKFSSWLFTIAKNASIDFFKKKKYLPLLNADNYIDPSPLASEKVEQKNIANIISKATAKLLPKYRRVISLRYESHLTFKEISQYLNRPLNTVKSWHRRALIALKEELPELL